MKISNNFNFQNINNNKNTNFKARIIKFPNSKNSNSISNPIFYQTLYGINFADIKLDIRYDDREVELLTIKKEDVKKYLLSKRGGIDRQRVKQFVFLYKFIVHNMKKENEEEQKRYLSSFEKYNNIIQPYKNDANDNLDISGEEYVSKIMHNMPTQDRIALETTLLSLIQKEYDEIPNSAYQKTLRLFQLSKIGDKYNFSDINAKISLIDSIEELSYQYGNNYSIEDLYSEIIQSAQMEDGSLDFNLLNQAFDIIYTSGLVYSPKYIMDTIKKYVSKNPHNEDKIIAVMEKLNNSDFSLNPDKKDFEDLMDLCFNGHHFSPQRAEKVTQFIKYIKDWINREQRQKAYLGLNRALFRYENYVEFCKKIILDYFKDYQNNNPTSPSVEEYFNSRIQGLNFL